MSERQLRRFSPLTVAVFLQLPPSPARSLAIASALGKVIRRDSTYLPLRHGRDGIGVHIGPTQRRAIIEELGITPRRFYQQVEEWISQNIAHRCKRGVVCLWVTPFMEECPGCGVSPETETPLRLPKFVKRGDTNSATRLPKSVPDTGDALRDGKGDAQGIGGYDGAKALEYLQQDSKRRGR